MAMLEGINIQRAQRQHSSVVVVIPILVRRALGIKAGDYVVFTSHPGTGVVEMSKFVSGDKNHEKNRGNSDRENRGGGARAQSGGRE
ncbi:hypothetical protein ES703_19520 [subsurface metagenome]